jgi:hypothetical protein
MPSRTEEAPYLSIVVAARNDCPEGLSRIQGFVDAWINQARRHHLSSELIVVEWNPPEDREKLANALRGPANLAPCQVRIIEVPREICPAIAKNAGIRRARGQFILATDLGIVFSDELMEFLALRRLEPERMYRIDRHDVESDVPAGATLDEHLEYCRTHSTGLRAREGSFALTPEGLRRNASDDITSAHSGLHFGEGWFPAEKYTVTAETFRWIHNDAEILARVPEGRGILLLEVEPGPGLGPLPQPLRVVDDQGSQVAEWSIAGRTTMALAVPPSASGSLRTFRLRLPGGGSPVLNDDRILNLAVFRCDWAEPNPPQTTATPALAAIRQNRPTLKRLLGARRKWDRLPAALLKGPVASWRTARLLGRRGGDIFEAGLDFQLGPGWFYLEESGGERFRWVSNNAQLYLRMPSGTSRLAMLLEPGPGQRYLPFTLVVRSEDEGGDELAKAGVQGLTYLEFTVPAAPGTIAALCFASENPETPSGSDPRLLSFRVLACGAGTRTTVATAETSGWPAMTVLSETVAKDWKADLEPPSRQLLDMGHPHYLHTNACGDFMLLSRERWFELRGYGELDPAIHVDSLLCQAAHHSGAREEVLQEPLRIYHVGNCTDTTAMGTSPAMQSILHEDMVWLIGQMRSLHVPVIFNRDDWGLAQYELFESSPAGRSTAGVSDI